MTLNKVVLPAGESVYQDAKGQRMPPQRWPTEFHYVDGGLEQADTTEFACVHRIIAEPWRQYFAVFPVDIGELEDPLTEEELDLVQGYMDQPLHDWGSQREGKGQDKAPWEVESIVSGSYDGDTFVRRCWTTCPARMLESLLEPVRDCADPSVDDVIIASGDPIISYEELLEAHERDSTRVLDLLVRHKLTGSSDKATIAVSEVVFAGHVVGNGQREPIPGKVAAIEHWEKPKTVSELRAYLGFCNYYSGYIKMYAEYAAPMTTMLKGNREETKKGSKKALVWNAESDRAFEGMKQALLSAVVLHLVDPDRGFVLRTDASDYAVGAVLEQVLDNGRHVPVAFWSRVLAEGQRRTWTPREKQAYAIVMALR